MTSPAFIASAFVVVALLLAKDSARRPAARTALVALALVLYARYLVWRGLFSLNRINAGAYVISASLYAAEIYGFVSLCLFYLQSLWPVQRSKPPFDDDAAPTVDVYITIYNEQPEILERTLAGVTALDYPRGKLAVYVLDDGPREEIKRLARSFGVGYLTREDNRYAKAGNINAALPRTKGELIAFFDCDHVPVRTFLKETVGFFRDEKVGIVQTPHNFYNPDSFQKNLFMDRRLLNEQELFYQVLMPGRDRFNSAFFAGTSGLIRRKALEEAGGFHVWSVIEDLYTSMELHARGWKSVYHDKVLTGALAPESFEAYLRQHQRWARGGVQVFVRDNPLFKPGLTLMQRLHYTGSLLYFFHGWLRLVYLLAPLPFLYLGWTPVAAPVAVVLYYFVPYYVSSQAAFGLMTRRFRNPFWSDVYETADSFAMARTAVETVLMPERLLFQVTPKGLEMQREKTRWTALMPHLVALLLMLGGIALTIVRMGALGVPRDAALLSLAWAFYNSILLGAAIASGRERPRVRRHVRLARRLALRLALPDGTRTGWTHDVSESGASALVIGTALLPRRVRIELQCRCGQRALGEGVVAWQRPHGKHGLLAGLLLEHVDPHALTRLVFSCPRSWERLHRPLLTFRESAADVIAAFEHAFETPDPEKARSSGRWGGRP